MLLTLLLACNNDRVDPVDSDSGADTAGETGETGDSGQTGDSGETGESADTGSLPSTWSWVVTSLEIGTRGAGFDLDGDGSPDNAINEVSGVFAPLLSAEWARATHVPVLQAQGVDAWTDDEVRLALFPGDDVDGDPSDNLSGEEVLAAGAAVDAEGLAVDTVATDTVNGAYGVELHAWTLEVGSLRFVSPVPLHAAGTMGADGHTGTLGLGLPLATVSALVDPPDPTILKALEHTADLDADGDGTMDTISAALAFSTAACVVLP